MEQNNNESKQSTNSGIIADFQFIGYKVDNFSAKSKNKISNIANFLKGNEEWSFSIALKKPTLYTKDMFFLGGIKLGLLLPDNKIDAKEQNNDNAIFSLECAIVGTFKVTNIDDWQNNREVYENLGKYQIPAILAPYLRSTVTSYFANAGFGTFIFPLINFTQMAFDAKVELEVIE